MNGVKCVFVGKLKKSWTKEACEHYSKALGRLLPLEEVTLKDAPGCLPEQSRIKDEGTRILGKVGPGDLLIALDEHGKSLSSRALATKLRGWIEAPGKIPCFVIGGAFGLSEKVLGQASFKLGLGPMTLPHELTRVVLLEQLYRAASIIKDLPYHH